MLKWFLLFISISQLSAALAYSVPKVLMDQITCEIDPKLAKKWAISEIMYFDDKEQLEESIELFFQKVSASEINLLCHSFIEKTLSEVFFNISQINPSLVRDTLAQSYSRLKIEIVNFCEDRGVPLFAAACFKGNFFWGAQKIHLTSSNKDIVLKMFFPSIMNKFSNERSKLALIHEFLHYFAWDKSSDQQHRNPYRYESKDPIYACTNMALPGHHMIFSSSEKESILLEQFETCRNHRL